MDVNTQPRRPSEAQPQHTDPALCDALADIYTFLLARRAARQRKGVQGSAPVK